MHPAGPPAHPQPPVPEERTRQALTLQPPVACKGQQSRGIPWELYTRQPQAAHGAEHQMWFVRPRTGLNVCQSVQTQSQVACEGAAGGTCDTAGGGRNVHTTGRYICQHAC